jgi:hypothetical protein
MPMVVCLTTQERHSKLWRHFYYRHDDHNMFMVQATRFVFSVLTLARFFSLVKHL